MGLFDIFTKIFGESQSKALEKQLKAREKVLSKMNPPVLEVKTERVTGEFALHLYRAVKPFMSMLTLMQDDYFVKKGMPYKRFLVMSKLSAKQNSILEELDEANLIRQVGDVSKQDFYRQVESRLKEYYAGFTPVLRGEMNAAYNEGWIFAQLGKIDFGKFFKEFDRGFREDDSAYQPSFGARESRFFKDDFILISRVLNSLELREPLARHLGEYAAFRNLAWDLKTAVQSLKTLDNLKDKLVFENLTEFIKREIPFLPEPFTSDESVLKDDIGKLVEEKKKAIDAAFDKVRKGKLDKLNSQLFGSETFPPVRNYTEAANEILMTNSLNTYLYHNELGLLKGFFILKYSKGIKELINLLIIKGKFHDADMQKLLGDAYYKCNETLDLILRFDESLSDSGEIGSRLKKLFLTISKDKKTPLIINDHIDTANEQAKKIITETLMTLKSLMTVFEQIEQTSDEGTKRAMSNIADFDGSRTKMHIDRVKQTRKDILLALNIIKSSGKA